MQVHETARQVLDTPERAALLGRQRDAYDLLMQHQAVIDELTRELIAHDSRALFAEYPNLDSIDIEIYGEYDDEGGTSDCVSVSVAERASDSAPADIDTLQEVIDELFHETVGAEAIKSALGERCRITRDGIQV